MADSTQTHFGYQQVATEEKAKHVANVFHSVAQRYDLMNDLMSFGIHRLWKRYTLHLGRVRTGQKVLDLAGGTGDLARHLSPLVGDQGQVVLADINDSMLAVGRDRLLNEGITDNITYVQADAETLPFPDNYFDMSTIAFGLRNVTDKQQALNDIYRVLKPGGKLLILEFSKPSSWLAPVYDAYSFHLLPKIGQLVLNDGASYRYLAESIRMHPCQTSLQQMMEKADFEQCRFHNLSAGIVALHIGYKF